MSLRLATTTTKRIELDEGDFIEVRSDLSKRQFNELVSALPSDTGDGGLTIAQAIAFQRELFNSLVVGWSLEVPVDLKNYDGLNKASGDQVDAAVAKHFESLTPSTEERSKSD